ncbi:MAG: SDR family NAD(P)-dependent oxidoreductase [Alistipes sp.]|jgi:short-subunit dehydrogenase|nr:SDR family NAD(P)-dependent oxidoreductase [Alistipes sp.]
MCFRRNRGEVVRGSAWALVTGAALGIGRQYAEQLAALGYNLLMVDILEAVSTEAVVIAEHHKVRCDVKVMDLATSTAARELHAWTTEQGYVFDIVINNAGNFSFCDILNTPLERIERILLLHDYTLTSMCRLYGEDMLKRGKGRLLNMSSYSIWMPFPGLALYSASKAYVKSFTEAFAKELRGTGVSATAICPAGIATDLYGLPKNLQELGVKIGGLMTAKSCARRGLKAMFKGRRVVVPDWWFRILIPICSFLPGFVIRPLRNFTQKWQK